MDRATKFQLNSLRAYLSKFSAGSIAAVSIQSRIAELERQSDAQGD